MGRHAHLTAALAAAAVVDVAVGVLLGLCLGGSGLDWGGAWLYGAAHTAVGLVFAALAAVTVQITGNSRGASGLALAALLAAYMLRAAGDVGSAWLSWLSPIGWAQRSYPFLDDRWWPLLLAVGFAAVLVVVGFALSVRRDVGAGLRATRAGRPQASALLGTRSAWRCGCTAACSPPCPPWACSCSAPCTARCWATSPTWSPTSTPCKRPSRGSAGDPWRSRSPPR